MAMATGDCNLVLGVNNYRKATVFVGGNSDDAIQIDAFAAARVAANDATGTITGWVNMPDISGTYTLMGLGDANAVEYLDFGVENGKLIARAFDGGAMQFDINSTDVVITPHKWHHIALVQNGTRPTLYVDGAAVAMTDTTTTDLTQWLDDMDAVDSGSIGATDSEAGGAALTNEFKGGISDVKYYNDALSATEIAQDYANIFDTTNLISWWDMDNDYVDSVSSHNGTAVGDVFLSNGYGELASRVKQAGAVVADDVSLANQGNVIIGALIIKA